MGVGDDDGKSTAEGFIGLEIGSMDSPLKVDSIRQFVFLQRDQFEFALVSLSLLSNDL